MMGKGRPPVTRARLLNYVDKHWPCPIRQICRATGAERSYVRRVLKQENLPTAIFAPASRGF
jgi:hypothetical protein